MAEIKEQTADALIECLNECPAPGDVGLIITDNKGNEFKVVGVWVTQFGQWHPHIYLEQVEDMDDRWIQPYWYQAEVKEKELEYYLTDKFKNEWLALHGGEPGNEQYEKNCKKYDKFIDDQRRYIARLKELAEKEHNGTD